MGVALERRGDLQRAITHYNRAIRLAPKNPRLYSNRAYAHFRTGDHQRAVEDCDHALELEPDLPMAYVNRGHARAAIGDHDRAAEDYRSALDMGSAPDVAAEAERGLNAIGRDAE